MPIHGNLCLFPQIYKTLYNIVTSVGKFNFEAHFFQTLAKSTARSRLRGLTFFDSNNINE